MDVPEVFGRLNGDCSGRVGILGGVQSIKKNLNVVRVMSIIAMWSRKLLIKVRYMFFEVFCCQCATSKVGSGC